MSDEIEKMLEAEALAAEQAEGGPPPKLEVGQVTRGHARARNLQVRFRDDEYSRLVQYAEASDLPVSTVVRLLVLQAITPADDLGAVLDRLERDVATLRLMQHPR